MKTGQFIGIALATVVATAAAPVAGQPAESRLVAPSAREVVDLVDGWRFIQQDKISGAEAPEFRDDDWAVVSVPHTWNTVGYYLPDRESHIQGPDTVNKTMGVGWYRLSFTPPSSFAGRRAWLEFDAASRSAEIWLNGKRIGEHRGGFSRFRLDATAQLKPGQPNILVVKTDNSKPAAGSSNADVLPLTGDFFVYGGLYRPVRLIATAPVHIDMLDHGGSGIYARTVAITGGGAEVAVSTKLRNDGRKSERFRVVARLLDDKGNTGAEAGEDVSLAAGGSIEIPQSLKLAKARLWQGVDDPYLYSLVVEVRSAAGRLIDSHAQNFGVREMRVDAEKGFFLNGKPYRLFGVGLHQGREGKGWATSDEDVAADVAMLREMGANSIRLTHYQHGRAIHELADRHGLILWDEIPLVSVWTLGKETEASSALRENGRQQMRELIRQNYNHPSVAVWGIANEVDFGNSAPWFLSSPDGEVPDPMPFLNELNKVAKEEDPSRPTALATCCEKRLFASNVEVPVTAPAADLGGANRYFGWYYGTLANLGPHLDSLRAERPAQPLSITEYGAGGATTMHTDNPVGGPADSRGRHQPEEYLSHIHEQSWSVIRDKAYLWASWLWVAFDFATTVRQEGDSNDINTKGLITFDRKIKKDAFFYYKAHWSNNPTVHVTGRRYVDRAYPVTDVRVYSNAPTTDLLVNGKSLGARADCANRICVWSGVRLATGRNEITATGRFADRTVADRVEWQLSPESAKNVRIDSGAILAAAGSAGRFGSDNFFEGGEAASVSKPSDYGKPRQPTIISGTSDSELIATYRRGAFTYRVPLENGRYDVKLTFVEPGEAAGQRVFDVVSNGRVRLKAFDIAQAAGSSMAAVSRSFGAEVRDGVLDLRFVPVRGDAVVSAIEVTPVAAGS